MPLTKLYQRVELQEAITAVRQSGKRIALIPTMGNLHPGHLSLIEYAREYADITIASIYVNPTQFGPGEDFDTYPRTLDADCRQLEQAGCNLVFIPSDIVMYPKGLQQTIRIKAPAELTNCFCGASRPGHFDGMLTVVARLLNLVTPDIAVFGEKDYQQLHLIRYLCEDFGYPVRIIGAPIIRESSGLAMSSRNNYLSDAQRKQATGLYQSLQFLQHEIPLLDHNHWSDLDKLIAHAVQIQRACGLDNEYLNVCNALNLEIATAKDQSLRILTAAQINRIRLIDNIALESMLQKNNKAEETH